eukprot:UN01012
MKLIQMINRAIPTLIQAPRGSFNTHITFVYKIITTCHIHPTTTNKRIGCCALCVTKITTKQTSKLLLNCHNH